MFFICNIKNIIHYSLFVISINLTVVTSNSEENFIITNLASRKFDVTCSSSDYEGDNDCHNVIDGDLDTFWKPINPGNTAPEKWLRISWNFYTKITSFGFYGLNSSFYVIKATFSNKKVVDITTSRAKYSWYKHILSNQEIDKSILFTFSKKVDHDGEGEIAIYGKVFYCNEGISCPFKYENGIQISYEHNQSVKLENVANIFKIGSCSDTGNLGSKYSCINALNELEAEEDGVRYTEGRQWRIQANGCITKFAKFSLARSYSIQYVSFKVYNIKKIEVNLFYLKQDYTLDNSTNSFILNTSSITQPIYFIKITILEVFDPAEDCAVENLKAYSNILSDQGLKPINRDNLCPKLKYDLILSDGNNETCHHIQNNQLFKYVLPKFNSFSVKYKSDGNSQGVNFCHHLKAYRIFNTNKLLKECKFREGNSNFCEYECADPGFTNGEIHLISQHPSYFVNICEIFISS